MVMAASLGYFAEFDTCSERGRDRRDPSGAFRQNGWYPLFCAGLPDGSNQKDLHVRYVVSFSHPTLGGRSKIAGGRSWNPKLMKTSRC